MREYIVQGTTRIPFEKVIEAESINDAWDIAERLRDTDIEDSELADYNLDVDVWDVRLAEEN